MSSKLLKRIVRYVVNGKVPFWGTAEYVSGGYVGIRQVGGRLDEAPESHVEVIPTNELKVYALEAVKMLGLNP